MVNIKRYFIELNMMKVRIDEFLAKTFIRAGYAGVDLIKTPLGTRIIIYADRPALIIGKRGQTLRQISQVLEKHFRIENPQITVSRIDNPELNAKVMAVRLALALEKGYHFRRAAFVALRRIMNAGALGAEVIISGKLTSERARYEKIRAGKVYKAGEQARLLVDRAVVPVLLKPGVYGVEVFIIKPAKPIDYIEILTPAEAGTTSQESAGESSTSRSEERGV